MTRETKLQVLAIFDELQKFTQPPLAEVTQGRRFSHMHCAVCGALQGMAVEHMPDCPVSVAQKAFGTLVPAFFDRDKWLAEAGNSPNHTLAPQPNP